MINRAYAVLEIRAAEEKNGKRTFKGIATTPSTDSYGDIVDPQGAEFKLPMPMLWQHDSGDPIGWVTSAKASKSGIEVEGEIASPTEPGPLADRLAMAWQYLKTKLVRGLSIGFSPIESARIEGTYGIHFQKWRWLELSAVTIPANMDASITAIKSADTKSRALSGLERKGAPASARTDALSGRTSNPKGTAVQTLQEMMDAQRTKTARIEELIALRKSEARSFDEAERSEIATLEAESDALQDDIIVERMNQRKVRGAQRLDTDNEGRGQRSGLSFVRTADPEDKFPGQSFVRQMKLRALARITGQSIPELAQKQYGSTHPKFVAVMKAAVAGGGTGSGEWGAELAKLDGLYTGDFITFLYGKTLFDQLPLREVPARVRVKGQDGQHIGYWVGESKAIPPSAGDYSTIDLTPLKVAALAVVSNELIEDSAPAADRLVRDSLVEASSQKVDTTFFSTTAASAGVSPAGLLNGLTAIQASGTDEAAVRADMQALAYPFVTNKMASGLVFAMNPAQGLSLGSFVNTFSMPSFPGINETGGTFMGRKAYTGDNVVPGQIILLRPEDIWKIGDSGVQVSMSDVATIEMNDAAAGASDTPVDMASHRVSMFQTESTAFKIVRRINFQKRRSTAVVYIDNAEYGGVTS